MREREIPSGPVITVAWDMPMGSLADMLDISPWVRLDAPPGAGDGSARSAAWAAPTFEQSPAVATSAKGERSRKDLGIGIDAISVRGRRLFEQAAAMFGALAARQSANSTVFVHRSVALAFTGTCFARERARIGFGSEQSPIELGLAG